MLFRSPSAVSSAAGVSGVTATASTPRVRLSRCAVRCGLGATIATNDDSPRQTRERASAIASPSQPGNSVDPSNCSASLRIAGVDVTTSRAFCEGRRVVFTASLRSNSDLWRTASRADGVSTTFRVTATAAPSPAASSISPVITPACRKSRSNALDGEMLGDPAGEASGANAPPSSSRPPAHSDAMTSATIRSTVAGSGFKRSLVRSVVRRFV